MTVKTVIKKILSARGWTVYRLAKESGLSRQSLEYILAEDPKSARTDTILRLQEAGTLSAAELVRLLAEEEPKD